MKLSFWEGVRRAGRDAFRSGRARIPITLSCIVVSLLLGMAYLFPNEFVRSPNPLQRTVQTSVVAYIEQLTIFPVWGILFTIGGVFMAYAITQNRNMLGYAHLYAASIFAGYWGAGMATAIINPGTYIVNALFSLFAVLVNIALLFSYSGRLGDTETGKRAVGADEDKGER